MSADYQAKLERWAVDQLGITGGGEWRNCRCPYHDDSTASGRFNVSSAVFKCQATTCGVQRFADQIAEDLDLPAPPQRPEWAAQLEQRDEKKKRKPAASEFAKAAEYVYTLADGTPHLRVEKLVAGGHKKFPQSHWTGSAWKSGLPKGFKHVLFHLSELVAKPGTLVIVTEGEKDALAAERLGYVATTAPGGAGKAHQVNDWSALSGRDVAVIADNDAAGQKHAAQVAGILLPIAKSVRVLTMPGVPAKGDLSDWIAAGGTSEQLQALVRNAELFAPAAQDEPEESRLDSRPRAKVFLDLEKSRASLDRALLELGDPPLFRKGSALLCFQGDGLYQPDSRGLGMELAKLVSFTKSKTVKSEDGDEEERSVPCYPPTTLTAGMLGAPHLFQAVRPLRRLVTAPRILSDGSITEEGGYYPSSGLFYVPRVRMGSLDLSIAKIKEILEEPFLDFPFEDASDFANALAIPLSIACAELYRGLSPVAVPRAPRFGSGKTKVVTVGVMLVTGAPPVTIDYEPGDSFTKEITSTLLTSPSAILIDNINETLDSPRFAAIMTSETTHARLLGGNQMATLENTCFWAATGNNIELTGEMIRRAFLIRLNPDVENPEERRNFRIADLDTWAKDPPNQSRYVSACLALAKHWISAGCPRFTERVSGSFRDWAEVVGGMLGMLGHSDFLANREDFRATADPEQEMWRDVVGEWWRAFGVREITSKDILDVITLKDVSRDETDHRNHREQPLMPLGNGLPQSKLTRLGMLLKKRVGQVFALPPGLGPAQDVKITAVGGNLSRSRYYLRPITPDRPPTGDQSGSTNRPGEKRSTRSTRSTSSEENGVNTPLLRSGPIERTKMEGPLGPLSPNHESPEDEKDLDSLLELPL